MQTVAELPEYIRTADKLLSPKERQDLIRYLAMHPKAGDLMEGTGGVRKLRWRRGDHGKSGGVRVIYYYYDSFQSFYLLTIYAKNEMSDLTADQKHQLKTFVEVWRNEQA